MLQVNLQETQQEVTRINKNGGEVTKNISYILQFIDLSEGIHKIKSKYAHDDKKCQTCGITQEVYDCFLECTNFKMI